MKQYMLTTLGQVLQHEGQAIKDLSQIDQITYKGGLTPMAIEEVRSHVEPKVFSTWATPTGNSSDPWKVRQPKKIAAKYLGILDTAMRQNHSNYADSPSFVKEAILNTAYNVGPSVTSPGQWPQMAAALAGKDYMKTALSLLSADTTGGEGVISLANRRAWAYNHIVHGIADVSQESMVKGTVPRDVAKDVTNRALRSPYLISRVTQGTKINPMGGTLRYHTKQDRVVQEHKVPRWTGSASNLLEPANGAYQL